jgi:hypothetical protein
VLGSEVPGRVGDVIQRLMAFDPGERYASAMDLLADLERLDHDADRGLDLASECMPAHEVAVAASPAEVQASRTLPLALVAVAAMLLCTVSVLLTLVLDGRLRRGLPDPGQWIALYERSSRVSSAASVEPGLPGCRVPVWRDVVNDDPPSPARAVLPSVSL